MVNGHGNLLRTGRKGTKGKYANNYEKERIEASQPMFSFLKGGPKARVYLKKPMYTKEEEDDFNPKGATAHSGYGLVAYTHTRAHTQEVFCIAPVFNGV